MNQASIELMGICEQSIRTVLHRSRSISHEREYFPGNKEADCVSQIFLEIANRRRNLINPLAPNNRISLHSEFQVSRLTRRPIKTGHLDIAIVRRTKMRPGRENWGEYLYDLVGVIEVKRNFRQNLNNDLKRVQNLLAAFPNAFGILVVTYWNKRGKEDEKVRNVMSKIRRWETWRANRINVFCEKNLASDNVHWEGKVVDRLGILKFVQN